MEMLSVDKSSFDNSWYKPGKPFWVQVFWYYINFIVFNSFLFPFYRPKVFLLKCFGAKIGKRLLVKPCVNIKYPWNLECGDYVSIGEGAWIDNLDKVQFDDHVTISQGAYLFCGNHNYKKTSFDLITKPIHLQDGVWIGAKSVVAPGVLARSHSVLAANSVANKELDSYSIYQGNPAIKVRKRVFE